MPGVQLNGGTTMLRLMVALLFVLVGCGPVGLVEQAPDGAHVDASAGAASVAEAGAPGVSPALNDDPVDVACPPFGVAMGSASETAPQGETQAQAVGDWVELLFERPAHVNAVTMIAAPETLLPAASVVYVDGPLGFSFADTSNTQGYALSNNTTDHVRITITVPREGLWLPHFTARCIQ